MKMRLVGALAAILFSLAALSAAPGAASTAPASSPSPAPSAASPAPGPTPSAIPTLPPAGNIINDVIDALSNLIKPVLGWDPNSVAGTVTYFRRFDMQVRMPLYRYRQVYLHQGTIINPRGWTIKPGQTVYVSGRGQPDGSLDADVITVRT
ncbi:MAG: hypothetical protein ACYDG0_10340 [Vulcanimicrobiaceae bacterium]